MRRLCVAAVSLLVLAPPSGAQEIEVLVAQLTNASAARGAAQALRNRGRAGFEALLDACRSGASVDAARIAIEVLGEMRTARATPALLARLEFPRPELRLAAVSALGKIRDRRALEPLKTRFLKEEDRTVRCAILDALAGFRWDDASRIAVELGENDPEPEVRRSICAAFHEDVRYEPVALKLLEDPSPMVRAIAVPALLSLKGEAVVDLMIKRLAIEPDSLVQVTLISAIKNRGDRRCVPALEPFLTHADPSLREAALTAIIKHEGKDALPRIESFRHDPQLSGKVESFLQDAARD